MCVSWWDGIKCLRIVWLYLWLSWTEANMSYPQWIGDGWCDHADTSWVKYGVYDCPEFNRDGGDCTSRRRLLPEEEAHAHRRKLSPLTSYGTQSTNTMNTHHFNIPLRRQCKSINPSQYVDHTTVIVFLWDLHHLQHSWQAILHSWERSRSDIRKHANEPAQQSCSAWPVCMYYAGVVCHATSCHFIDYTELPDTNVSTASRCVSKLVYANQDTVAKLGVATVQMHTNATLIVPIVTTIIPISCVRQSMELGVLEEGSWTILLWLNSIRWFICVHAIMFNLWYFYQ